MLKPVIRRLILKRFRSIPSEQVEFDNPTFLVGVNGSGKSNFVDAFAFLAEAMSSPIQAVFDKRGGIAAVRNKTSGKSYPPNLGLGVEFGELNGRVNGGRYAFEIRALPNYGFEVMREQCLVRMATSERYWFDRRKQEFTSNVPGLKPSLDPASLGLPVVAGDARFSPVLRTLASMRVYSLEPAKLREMQDPDSGVSLRADGGNASSVLQEIERHSSYDVKRIGEILATIVPHTKRVRTIKHGNKLSLEFTQEWGERKRLKFEAFNMSDGTLRALGLLMAVYQRPTPTLMVIEEPEATIHPGALGAILDLLRHASRKMQIVVTTHSPEVLDAKWIEDAHLRMVSWEEGATRITPISESSRKALQQHLMGAGELLRSNALQAPPLFLDVGSPQSSLFEVLE
ncbi:MAG TPA: AAA family ATPase [Blastocatellia bacterium]|nr:AAA family ATPase [Blastocatellia bacterium]